MTRHHFKPNLRSAVTAALLEADADILKARMKALGYTSIPGKAADRLKAYRALKADVGANEQAALFDAQPEPTAGAFVDPA